jgi:hypothetical protein
LDRAGPDGVDLSPLDHGVGGLDADRDGRKIDQCQGGFNHLVSNYTILNESFRTHRRMRLKLIGLVIPSPVGLAMVNEQKPSPP